MLLPPSIYGVYIRTMQILGNKSGKTRTSEDENAFVELFHRRLETLSSCFDIEVVNVNSTKLGLYFTFKLPDQVNHNSYHDELRLPTRRDKKIKMALSGQSVDVIHLSSKGASVLLPHANIDDVEVGKAIRLIDLNVDGYKLKANAEINYIREHFNGAKILTDLRFMYFGINDESNLEQIIAEKAALLTLKQMTTASI